MKSYYKKTAKKTIISFALIISFVFSTTSFGNSTELKDNKILSDPVRMTLQGTSESKELIKNLRFTDVPSNHWAREAITRAGALGLIKGDNGTMFRPNSFITKEEAIAFAIRIMGLESQALRQGAAIADTLAPGTRSNTYWSIGYLNVAMQYGMITQENYNDALIQEQETLDSDYNFIRGGRATREEVASWVAIALNRIDPQNFPIASQFTNIYNFTDWSMTDTNRIAHMETLLKNNIIIGSSNMLSPKGAIRRADMASILAKSVPFYQRTKNYTTTTGTVATYIDEQMTTTGIGSVIRNFYIRANDGSVDIIQYQVQPNGILDAVVSNGGVVTGLTSLNPGDAIQYTYSTENGSLIYVNKISNYSQLVVTGSLYLIDLSTGQITIKQDNDKYYTYPMIEGIYKLENDIEYLQIGEKFQMVTQIPIGSKFEIALSNHVVKKINFVGDEVIENETRGIVVENDPLLGYITIVDNNGNRVTMNYVEGSLKVKKKQHYTTDDEIGYYGQIFPGFKYNPLEASIQDLEPGDIVFIRPDSEDPQSISQISAATNYNMRYGRVLQVDSTSPTMGILLEYENKQTTWLDMVDGVFVSKEGKPATAASIYPGDWIKVLVNTATIEPGYVMESVKEVAIEGNAHYISSIIRGQIGSIDNVQKKISLQNYQKLDKIGWTDYHEVERLDISGNDIEYYYNGSRISLDYALNYFKRGGADAYIAMENYYGGERIRKITFRTGRDEILNPDNVIVSSGDGSFMLSTDVTYITSDPGTIVRRHGRLVDPLAIVSPDYATVVLNGESHAAVVDITETPDTSAVVFARGRIQSVDEGKTFKTQSVSILTGMKWFGTPIQRIFSIDYNTKFYDSSGVTNINDFIDYTDETVYDKVYTIVTDGSRAAWVIDQPYPRYAIRGTVYEINDGNVMLNNVTVYEENTGKWMSTGRTVVATVSTPQNGVIVKNGSVVYAFNNTEKLEKGDQVKVMTDEVPNRYNVSFNADGYIILVEK